MPFIEEDEETKRARELAEGGGVPVAGTQAGTIPGTTGTPTPGAKPQNSFVDVAAYLKANKEQAGETANRVASKMAEERTGLQSGLQTATEGYKQNVQAGTVNPNDELVSQAAENPTEFVKNTENVSNFAKLRDASYTGPGNIEDTADFGTVLQKIQSGKEKAANINTSEGRKAYLTSIGQNPTAGVVSLDDLLIGADPGARARIEAEAGQFGTLDTELTNAKQQAAAALAAGKGTTEGVKTGVANRFTGEGGVIPSFQALLEQKLAGQRSDAQMNANMIKQSVEGGNALTQQERDLIGAGNWDEVLRLRTLLGRETPFADSQAKYGRNIDLLPYLTMENPDVQITRENAASPEDYAMEAALQQLSGDKFDVLPSDVSQAGTAPKTLARMQGDPEADLRGLLNELDTTFVDQYRGTNLGAGDDAYWMAEFGDPAKRQNWQNMLDIMNRNVGKLTPTEANTMKRIQEYLDTANPVTPPDTGGTIPAPTGGEGRVRSWTDPATGIPQQMWWDGNAWVKAPTEYKHEQQPDGSTKNWKFDFNTGQYTAMPDTPAGKTPPGVVVAF